MNTTTTMTAQAIEVLGPRVVVSVAASSRGGFLATVRSVAHVVDPAARDEVQVRVVDVSELEELFVGPPVVAVSEAPLDAGMVRAALAGGASGVVERDVDAVELGAVLGAAAAGHSTVRDDLVRDLLTKLDEPPADLDLRAGDLELLQDVADGLTLDELAAARRQSSRTIRRELRDIWARLGVPGRAPGLVRAARWGLLRE